MIKELTTQQELFLEYLFNDPECLSDTRRACIAAGYAKSYHRVLVAALQDEILDRSNNELVYAAPRAVRGLVNAMDEDGTTPRPAERLRAVESVLDRIGLAKKTEVAITSEAALPIFVLPTKREVELPDTDG